MIIKNIEDLNINDSILLKTVVLVDSVQMYLDYIEDYTSQKSSLKVLILRSVAKFHLK